MFVGVLLGFFNLFGRHISTLGGLGLTLLLDVGLRAFQPKSRSA